MVARRALLGLLAAAVLFQVARAQAPAGFRTHSDADSGLTFHYPVEFQELPVPPTESVTKAKYVRKTVPDACKDERGALKPQFEVFVLPRGTEGSTPKATAPAESKAAESKPTESRPESAESQPASRAHKSVRELFEAENRIEGFEAFKARRLRGWDLKPIGPPSGRVREYALVREKFVPSKADKLWTVGYLWIRDEGSHYLGLLGVSMSPIEKDAQAEFRKVARSIVTLQAGAKGEAERAYAGSKLPNVPFRIGVRRALAKGWKAVDTDNFIIVHHTDNEKLVNKIARDLEAIRPMYVEMFPPVKSVETVAIVRVCRDRTEYLAYGGAPTSGGYWHPGNEELVFYDYAQTELEIEKKKGRRLTDKDSFVVLYHEAFHQYIHFAVGQVAPHDWFNEGHGDYFSGAIIPQYGTRVTSIGPSRWRITRAKREIDPETVPQGSQPVGPWIPVEKLARAPREEYYGALQSNYYTGGWALVYFLRESPEAKKHPKWSKILVTYFETLKAETKRLNIGPGDGRPDARNAALAAAFDGVNFHELDAAVRTFTQRMKHPWPEDLDL
jgi:hypothetical protein